jgi:hypothetical protein
MSNITPEFAAAFAKAHAAFKQITRDRTVRVSTRNGGTYEFSYAPLESILRAVSPALAANDLTISQGVVSENGQEFVETKLLHASGGFISNRVRVIVREDGPQAYGSGLTYARRYGIALLLGICADDDDDANAAEGNSAQVVNRNGKEPTHVETIRAYMKHGQTDKAAQILAGLDENGKRAVWKQLTAAERERLKVFFPRQQQTEVVQ